MKKLSKVLLGAVAMLSLLALFVAQPVQTVSASTKKEYLLVMGHGAGDPGARGNGNTEANLLRKKLLPHLEKYAKEVKKSKIVFYNPKHNMVTDTRKGGGSHKVKKTTSVIMFHFDASTSRYANGGHVIICHRKPNTREKKMAAVIKKYVGLNKAYNGYSYRTDLKNCNVLRRRGIDFSLVETGFITNKRDYQQINKHIDKIAKGYIEAITGETVK